MQMGTGAGQSSEEPASFPACLSKGWFLGRYGPGVAVVRGGKLTWTSAYPAFVRRWMAIPRIPDEVEIPIDEDTRCELLRAFLHTRVEIQSGKTTYAFTFAGSKGWHAHPDETERLFIRIMSAKERAGPA